MAEENISQKFKLKNIEEIKNYFIKETDRNELMIKKYKKVCSVLNFIKHFLILVSVVTGCISISTFASLIGIPIGIRSCAIRLKICQYLRKRRRNMIIVLVAKTKLNSIKVLISKASIDSYIDHDKFVLVNNVLREYNYINEEIKNSKNSAINQIF